MVELRLLMVYTLDQEVYIGALIEPTTPLLRELLGRHPGEAEFLGHTVFDLPMFYFEHRPPDYHWLGIRWIPLLEEA